MSALGHIDVAMLAFLSMDPWDLGLSAGIFATVFMLVTAVFGQPGEIRVSPQREAALATGAADRKTVFEMTLIRPIMWMLLMLAHRLAMPRLKGWLRRKLVAAGSPNYYTPEEYLALGMLVGLVLACLLEMLHVMLVGDLSPVTIVAGMVFGIGLILYQVHDAATKRISLIAKRVPYALDLIALAMGAGATFTEAVRAVVRDETEDPFNGELRAVLAEIELGTTRRQALQNLSDRVPLELLRSIVASVIQAEELGTPLAEVLHSQATLLRMQRTVRAENSAAVASVRILVPSLLILMSVVLAVFAPAIVRMIRGGMF
jgi:tight adherence protein C